MVGDSKTPETRASFVGEVQSVERPTRVEKSSPSSSCRQSSARVQEIRRPKRHQDDRKDPPNAIKSSSIVLDHLYNQGEPNRTQNRGKYGDGSLSEIMLRIAHNGDSSDSTIDYLLLKLAGGFGEESSNDMPDDSSVDSIEVYKLRLSRRRKRQELRTPT